MEARTNFDEIWAILKETAEERREMQREMAEQRRELVEQRQAREQELVEQRQAREQELVEQRQAREQELAEQRQAREQELTEQRQAREQELTELKRQADEQRQERERERQALELELAESKRLADEERRELDKEIRRVAKIVGDIGNKFGSFTEGMAFPSMDKVLRKQFGMKIVTTNYVVDAGLDSLEIDVLGIANGEVNTVVIVEVKSHLKKRDIEQTLKTIERFRRLHPDHANKKLYGIIACVSGAKEQREEAQKAGLFVASIHDEVFELKTPAYFVPRDFSLNMVE